MKFITGRNGIVKGIITKAKANKAVAMVQGMVTSAKARKMFVPERPGQTVALSNLVDLTKIKTPDDTIKNRWVLVGTRHSVLDFAASLA